jgi:hypothetical protein
MKRSRKRNPETGWNANSLRCIAVAKEGTPSQKVVLRSLLAGIVPSNQDVLVDIYKDREDFLALSLQWHPSAPVEVTYIGLRGGMTSGRSYYR